MPNDSAINFILDDTACQIHTFGRLPVNAKVPFYLMPIWGDTTDLVEEQHKFLDPLFRKGVIQPFVLGIFEIKNWYDDLSPWPAPAMGRTQSDFAGNGPATLDWIQKRFIPAAEERLPLALTGILGYSMGGMFALWVVYQTDIFRVCGCCSGSLWFDGFVDYLEHNEPKKPCAVYVSLGGREERTHHSLYAQVGVCTRRTTAILKGCPMVQNTAYVLHAGGHTDAIGTRLVAALKWMNRF